VFIRRAKGKSGKQPCARCSILRMYFATIFLLVVVGVLAGDKTRYFSFVNKETGVYLVFTFGALVSMYRILEWYFVYRRPKDKL
jgi:hypothetical protein